MIRAAAAVGQAGRLPHCLPVHGKVRLLTSAATLSRALVRGHLLSNYFTTR